MAMTASMILRLRDRMSVPLCKNQEGLKRLSRVGSQAIGRLNRSIGRVSSGLAGLGATVGLIATVKQVANLDAKMVRLGTQANVSASKMDALKKQIFETATAPDIKVDPSQMIGAIDQIIERTGDMEFVEQNMTLIGQAIQATGADGTAIGGLVAEFQKMGLSSAEVAEALGTLTVQGKNGAFTLENLASLGPRVISAYTATGRSGTGALREMGAALQVIRTATGSSEMAATAFEAVMRSLVDKKKQDALKKMGVNVRNSAGEFKPIHKLIAEIVENSGASAEVLGQVFDAEAIRAFNAAMKDGGIEKLDRFYQIQDDGSTITEDSARNAATFNANLTNLKTSFMQFADVNLTGPIRQLTEKLNKLTENPEQVQTFFKTLAWGLGSIIAIKGLSSVVKTVGTLSTLVSRRRRPGGLGSSPASLSSRVSSVGAQPVFVTNWPAGGIDMVGDRMLPARGKGKGRSQRGLRPANAIGAGRALRLGGKVMGKAVGPLLMSALAGMEVMNTWSDPNASSKQKSSAIGGTLGGVAGAIAGQALFPIPVVGAILGGWAGGELGRLVGNLFGEDRPSPVAVGPGAAQGEITVTLDVKLDENTRLSVTNVESQIPGYNVNTGRAIGPSGAIP